MNQICVEEIHKSVLLTQTLAALDPQINGKYLDGTLGLGGHARAVLEKAPGSQLCGLDRDEEALKLAKCRLEGFGARVHLFHARFGDFSTCLKELGWKKIDGALLDLGVSSLQFDKKERGFSLREDARLDMRMDSSSDEKTAWDIVNKESFAKLKECFAIFGEDPMAGRIARRIVDEREKHSIDTTAQLANLVWNAYPPAWRKSARNHPATRVFQALRMTVNNELGQLRLFLDEILPWIVPGGRVVIISFHSLEDRMVKHTMRDWAKGCLCPPTLPICQCGHKAEARILYKKPLTATADELAENPRARSAKLRAAEKLDEYAI